MVRVSNLRIFDTATRTQRDFVPVKEGHASIYLCGATPQAQPHIGHLRSGVAFDILRRWLMAQGLDVAFVRNVTDIDDKILNKAADNGRPGGSGFPPTSASSPRPTTPWASCHHR